MILQRRRKFHAIFNVTLLGSPTRTRWHEGPGTHPHGAEVAPKLAQNKSAALVAVPQRDAGQVRECSVGNFPLLRSPPNSLYQSDALPEHRR